MANPQQSPRNPSPLIEAPAPWMAPIRTARLVLTDGTVLEGDAIGAEVEGCGELCFNTAMTGYQEILTDPSYSGQIIVFTFPHIGNVGANDEDIETVNLAASAGVAGLVLAIEPGAPSNYRAQMQFDLWLKARGIPGIAGIDTRALTAHIREGGMQNAILAQDAQGAFDTDALVVRARALAPMAGRDLVPEVASRQRYEWDETSWTWGQGFGRLTAPRFHVAALDFGIKRNILRLLADRGCQITVLPPDASAEAILTLKPDGVFLSNGPGDPEATGVYAVPTIRALIEARLPLFGICLGHQMLALALGGRTVKMAQGHHGANHPVREIATGRVTIVSMNHGFAVDAASLPESAEATHVSLFDGSNCGLRLRDGTAFSVQQHPEASPGPQDSHALFDAFVEMMRTHRAGASG
jgi:carbamoyl-phosphate synthase small subunit